MISQHLGRLFLPGTLKKFPCFLNELLVYCRQESSGIGRRAKFLNEGREEKPVSISSGTIVGPKQQA